MGTGQRRGPGLGLRYAPNLPAWIQQRGRCTRCAFWQLHRLEEVAAEGELSHHGSAEESAEQGEPCKGVQQGGHSLCVTTRLEMHHGRRES